MKARTLLSSRPDLVAQLHPTKNGHIDLGTVTLFSHKMPIWMCSNGHEYASRVADREKGFGCPYCVGKKVCTENSLAFKFPELIKEWHPKNILKPTEVTAYSHKKVWWTCENGHEWEATIASRTYQGSGCEYCLGKRASPGNNLVMHFPEVTKDWHPTKNKKSPNNYSAYSNKKVWWICSKGHSWEATIADRTYRKRGCSVCHPQDSRLQLFLYCELKCFYEVKYKHRIDGLECDIYLPKYNIAIETDGHWWHKDRHDYDKKKANRLHELGVKLISIRENGLEQVSPYTIRCNSNDNNFIIAKSLMNLMYSLNSDSRLLEYNSLTEPMNEVEYLSQVANYPAPLLENSLEKANPELSKLWDYDKNGKLKPSDVPAYSNMVVNWKCINGHAWSNKINYQNTQRYTCGECWRMGRKVKTVKT